MLTTSRRVVLAILAVAGIAVLDAIAGRLLHAHLDPSWPAMLTAGFVAAHLLFGPVQSRDVLRSHRRLMVGVGAGLLSIAVFRAAATALVGWNESLAWTYSGRWLWTTAAVSGIGAVIPSSWLRRSAPARAA